jgi:GST-like protein
MVNRTSGPPEEQLHERHDASDFETQPGEDRRAPATSS